VWISNKPARPAQRGEAGVMLADIIERAAKLKAERGEAKKPPRRASRARSTPRRRKDKQ